MFFFFYCYGAHLDLHVLPPSFPTRRSSDQTTRDVGQLMRLFGRTIDALTAARDGDGDPVALVDKTVGWHRLLAARPQVEALAELTGEDMRSEEHTSELQSLMRISYDVFCLKKKIHIKRTKCAKQK